MVVAEATPQQLPRWAPRLVMQRVAAVAGGGDARGAAAATAGTATDAGPAAGLDLPPAPRGAPPTPSAELLADN